MKNKIKFISKINSGSFGNIYKIEYNNKAKSVTTPNWIDPKNLHNYTLPTFTKKIVNYLENHKWKASQL